MSRFAIITFVAGAFVTSVARAGFVTYVNDFPQFFPGVDEWYDGLASWQLIDFVSDEQQPLNDQYADLGIFFPTNDWIVTSSAAHDLWGVIGGNPIGSVIDITFETPQYAFGVYFPGGSLELYSGGTLVFESIEWGWPGGAFLGVISDQPFDTVRIKDSDGAVFIDDIVWGTPWAVPGPGALVALGVGALVGRSRRRTG